MKRLASILGFVALSALLTTTQLYSAESTINDTNSKDECLLISMNCKDYVDSIQQRIEKLNNEIVKGTDVYTRDELNILRQKLDDAIKTRDNLELGG
jgi:hypothetical protein